MIRDLGDGILLRPLREGDGDALAESYVRNREHLAPWDPARPDEFYLAEHQEELIRGVLDNVAADRMTAFVLTDAAERVVGRVNLNNIVRGAFHSTDLGYWIDAEIAGRGIMRRAVATACDHARETLGLHRVQAATLLHNEASQRVLRATGFTPIGRAERYLRIAGEWQDHLLFQRILD